MKTVSKKEKKGKTEFQLKSKKFKNEKKKEK